MSEQTENDQKAVRIQGSVLGHPIDVTITECDTTEVVPAEPTVAEVTEPEQPTEPVEPEVAPADPAPVAAEGTDKPKNPEGNAEQL